jgi:hypothetical protein
VGEPLVLRAQVHETRQWRCSHRGWLLVHAAKRFAKDFALDDPLRVVLDDEFGTHWALDLPTGALIGMVNVVDCVPTRMPRTTMIESAEIFRLDGSPGNALSFSYSSGQFPIGEHKASLACPMT